MRLAELLAPELTDELDKTRRVLERVPDGRLDFRSAEKSMPLSRLAGHTAELAGILADVLTYPEIDMQAPSDPRRILRMETREKLLAEYEPMTVRVQQALAACTDDAMLTDWRLLRKGTPVLTGSRYKVYRIMLDHMIHHRAQLGVYLRLLGVPVPATFGPSADETV